MPCLNSGCITRTKTQAEAHFFEQLREHLLLLDQTAEALNEEIYGQTPNLETVKQEMAKHNEIHKELWFIACSLRRLANPEEYNPSIDIMQGNYLYMLVYPDCEIHDPNSDVLFASDAE